MAILMAPFVAAMVTAAVLWFWLRADAAKPMDVACARSLHEGVVPRIGGLAMAVGVVVATLLVCEDSLPIVPASLALGLLALSSADDWFALPVWPRLLGHVVAAGVLAWSLSMPTAWAVPIMLAIVWMTNLYNFMDGADGLAGAMTIIGFGAYAIVAWPDQPGLACMALCVAAAAAAFTLFNVSPARVFMGDAGSIPLGFLAGALGLLGWHRGVWPAWFPILVFLPFIADSTVTLGQRLLAGEKPWQAHRNHYYQRVIQLGCSHRCLLASAATLMIGCAGSAVLALAADLAIRITVVTFWMLTVSLLLLLVERRWRRRQQFGAEHRLPTGGVQS